MKNFSYPETMSRPIGGISRGSFENVRLSGRNVGASMIAGGGDGGAGESPGSCSINIYINNDVHGINNSVLLGSEVRMGDPGVSLCLEGLNLDRGFHLVTKKKGMDSTSLILLLAFVTLIISVFAYFSG
ncbi:hypothetical protein C2S51_025187 [Perilla frutescens var. frutescens]|nr:hypothetical protein C2S51_025187 [Perilla frutescens var. frutescens]